MQQNSNQAGEFYTNGYNGYSAEGNSDPLGIAGVIDVETTGLDPSHDEIVELAICLFEFVRASGEITGIVEEYVGLREPCTSITPGASRVHGLTFSDLKGRKLDDEKVESMIERAEFLISHNVSFDKNFVRKLFPVSENKTWLCSMKGIDWKNKGFASKGLQQLLYAHSINVKTAHRAKEDVLSAIELLSLNSLGGKTYLAELLEKLPGKCEDNRNENL